MSATSPRPASLTVTEAAKATGTSRTTVRRRLDAGDLPGAWREDGADGPNSGPWRIPVPDLLAAGFTVNRPRDEQPDDEPDPSERVAELEREVADLRRRAEVAEAVATERANALDDARRALRALTAHTGPAAPSTPSNTGPIPDQRTDRRTDRDQPSPDQKESIPVHRTGQQATERTGRIRSWWRNRRSDRTSRTDSPSGE